MGSYFCIGFSDITYLLADKKHGQLVLHLWCKAPRLPGKFFKQSGKGFRTGSDSRLQHLSTSLLDHLCSLAVLRLSEVGFQMTDDSLDSSSYWIAL
jgi:hypothetical protein